MEVMFLFALYSVCVCVDGVDAIWPLCKVTFFSYHQQQQKSTHAIDLRPLRMKKFMCCAWMYAMIGRILLFVFSFHSSFAVCMCGWLVQLSPVYENHGHCSISAIPSNGALHPQTCYGSLNIFQIAHYKAIVNIYFSNCFLEYSR